MHGVLKQPLNAFVMSMPKLKKELIYLILSLLITLFCVIIPFSYYVRYTHQNLLTSLIYQVTNIQNISTLILISLYIYLVFRLIIYLKKLKSLLNKQIILLSFFSISLIISHFIQPYMNYYFRHLYAVFFKKDELTYEDLHEKKNITIIRSSYSLNDFLIVPEGGTMSGFYIFPETTKVDSAIYNKPYILEAGGSNQPFGTIANLNSLEDGTYLFYFTACHWESDFKITIKTE